jgi:hypothetical protein
LVAAPTLIVKLLLAAVVNEPSVAVSVYVPSRSILQPVKVATPATTGSGFALVQLNVAPPELVIVNVTEVVLSVVIVLPPRSCTFTTGCAGKTTPPVELVGWVVKPTFAAAPTVMVKLGVLTAEVNPVAAAVKV